MSYYSRAIDVPLHLVLEVLFRMHSDCQYWKQDFGLAQLFVVAVVVTM